MIHILLMEISLIYKNLPFGIFVLKMTTMISFEYFVGNEINS